MLGVVLWMVCSALPTMAQKGWNSANFLLIEPNPTSVALGNTGVALVQDHGASFWNPALLASQRHTAVSATYSNWLANLGGSQSHSYITGHTKLRSLFPSIQPSRFTTGYVSADITFLNLGEQMATNAVGAEIGTFKNYEYSIRASYGSQVWETMALGVGLQFITSSLGANQRFGGKVIHKGRSLALNVGGLWDAPSFELQGITMHPTVGASLTNFGRGLTYMDGQEPIALPLTLRLGSTLEFDVDEKKRHTITLTNEFKKLLVRRDSEQKDGYTAWSSRGALASLFTAWGAVDVQDAGGTSRLGIFEQFSMGLGIDYTYDEAYSGRIGYYYEHPLNGNRKFFTTGFGVEIDAYRFDFSYILPFEEYHPLAKTLRISLSYRL